MSAAARPLTLLVVLLVLLAACTSSTESPTPSAGSSVAGAPGGSASPDPVEPAAATRATRLAVGPEVGQLATAGGSLWAAHGFGVSQIDPDSGELLRTVSVGAVAFVAADGDELWIGSYSEGRVAPVDAASGEIGTPVSVPDGSAMAIADGSVWVHSAVQGTVTRVDAASGDVLSTTRVADAPQSRPFHAFAAADIAVGGGQVWTTRQQPAALVALDAADGTVIEELPVPAGMEPGAVAIAGGALWAADAADSPVPLLRRDLGGGDPTEIAIEVVDGVLVSIRGFGVGKDGSLLAVGAPVVDRYGRELLNGVLISLDPTSSRVGHIATLPAAASDVVESGSGEPWVTIGYHEVASIDLEASTADAATPAPSDPELAGGYLAIDETVLPGMRCGADLCDVPADVFAPASGGGLPVIVVVQGGRGFWDDRRYLSRLASTLAQHGAVVFNMSYRGEVTGGTPLDSIRDVACSIGAVGALAEAVGGDSARVVLVGHHVGGDMVLEVGIDLLTGELAVDGCPDTVGLPIGVVAAGGFVVPQNVLDRAVAGPYAVRMVHGTADESQPVSCQVIVDVLSAAGTDAACTELPGLDLGATFDPRSTLPTVELIMELAGGV